MFFSFFRQSVFKGSINISSVQGDRLSDLCSLWCSCCRSPSSCNSINNSANSSSVNSNIAKYNNKGHNYISRSCLLLLFIRWEINFLIVCCFLRRWRCYHCSNSNKHTAILWVTREFRRPNEMNVKNHNAYTEAVR